MLRWVRKAERRGRGAQPRRPLARPGGPDDYNGGMSNLLAHLNEAQLAAVTLPAGHALILAGAGSGKTRVLTTRIAWLISTGQVSPQSLLAVTFTNKAAREMMTRLSAILPINPRGMWIGTFHGLCNRLLRTHARDAGLSPSFQILDSSDQLSAIKRLLRAAGVDDEKYPPKNLQYFINQSKEAGLRAGAVEVFETRPYKNRHTTALAQQQSFVAHRLHGGIGQHLYRCVFATAIALRNNANCPTLGSQMRYHRKHSGRFAASTRDHIAYYDDADGRALNRPPPQRILGAAQTQGQGIQPGDR